MKGLTLQDLKIHELYRASRKVAAQDGWKFGGHSTEKKDKKASVVKSMIEELPKAAPTVEEPGGKVGSGRSPNQAVVIKDDQQSFYE